MSGRYRRLFIRLILLALPLVLLVLVGLISLSSNSDDTLTFQGNVHPQQLSHDELQRQLQQLKRVILQLEDQLEKQQSNNDRKDSPCTSSYIQKQIQKSELERGKQWHNEYEIIPHSLFTLNAFYPTESGLGRRVVERPLASRRQDLQEAVSTALSLLNQQKGVGEHSKNPKRYSANDLVEGLYRIDPIEGTQYEFWFQPAKNKGSQSNNNTDLVKVTLLRPHTPLTVVRVDNEELLNRKSTINIVVPLAGRFPVFQSFLSRFQRSVLSQGDKSIHLTIVFFGDAGWEEIRSEMLNFEKRSQFNNFHLLNVNATFSRARAVQMGIEHWEGSAQEDVLLFICDVDVDFDAQFIQRCRRNTKPQRQAYFPMVFSLYNPNATGRLVNNQGDNQQPLLSKETGFWRDFGFGMVCTYMSDFIKLGGFRGHSQTGWGGEDLYLYRKYIRSNLRVIRSPDPNLFHIWHPKSCPDSLGVIKKRSCLQSRARNEASHDQLGLLFFLADEANRQTTTEN